MTLILWNVLVIAAICLGISAFAYWKRILTGRGAVAAFVIADLIGLFGGLYWLILLFVFTLISYIATKYKFALKEALGAQEGVKGERGPSNVLASGLVPAIVAIISFFEPPLFPKYLSGLVFVSALSAAAADTLASEIGVLSPKTYLITSFKRVKPGTDGGISLLGELAALLAAIFTSALGYALLFYSGTVPPNSLMITVPIAAGFIGCHIDSVIGATLERKKLVTKAVNNCTSIAIATMLAWVLIMVFW